MGHCQWQWQPLQLPVAELAGTRGGAAREIAQASKRAGTLSESVVRVSVFFGPKLIMVGCARCACSGNIFPLPVTIYAPRRAACTAAAGAR